jgi:hypothetical protein
MTKSNLLEIPGIGKTFVKDFAQFRDCSERLPVYFTLRKSSLSFGNTKLIVFNDLAIPSPVRCALSEGNSLLKTRHSRGELPRSLFLL